MGGRPKKEGGACPSSSHRKDLPQGIASITKHSSVHTETSPVKISEFANAGEDAVPNADGSTQHLGVFRNS